MEVRSGLSKRGWWLTLIVILIVAAAFRVTGYNFSLPYIDHPDEPNFNIAAQMIIDSGTSKSLNYQGYPPGIITINYLLLRFLHDPTQPSATVIGWIRLLSIAASLALLVVIALLARQLASPTAGLLAATLWAVNPAAVERARYATADTFVALFTVLAVYLVLKGVSEHRDNRVTGGIIANLFGIVFKYQSGFVLPLLLLVSLAPLRDRSADRRRIRDKFILHTLIVGAFAFWLVLIYPALDANQIPNWVAPTDHMSLPSPAQLLDGISLIASTSASGMLLLVAALGGLLLSRRHIGRVAVVGGALLCWLIGVGLFGDYTIRQLVGALALLTVLVGAGLSGWVDFTARFVKPRWALSTGVIILMALLLRPDLNAVLADARNRTLPDRRNDLATWMDTSQQPGAYIAEAANHKTFNREWGGYPGINAFPLYAVADLSDRSIEEWRAANVTYAIISTSQYQALQATPDGRAELAQTLLLKSYPPSDADRGPDMVVLRLYPIQHPADGQLGTIHLIGYDLNTTDPTAGETLDFTLYWQAEQPTGASYVVYNHLIDAETGEVVAQIDGDPLPDLRRPTMMWDDPAEILVSRPFSLSLADVPPGTYRLVTGFYDRDTGQRLRSPDGADSLTVATIHVH